jgi:predicted nucleotide-binding protein (sugar kinase/HSP70/actin superfamily)
VRIAVPRALHYYYLFPHWEAFWTQLGHEVVVTPPTDRESLARGIAVSLADICLPLKAFLGHVQSARALGEGVFIPRLVSRDPCRYYCPKFLALPDLAKAKFPGLSVYSVEINAKKGPAFTRDRHLDLARSLGATPAEGERAFQSAETAMEESEGQILSRFRAGISAKGKGPRIALVGHPYTVEDAYLSSGVKDWLEEQGVQVIPYEGVPGEALERVETGLFRDIYWECAYGLTRAALHFLSRSDLEGMILLSAFGCGPDSFISDIVGRRARDRGNFPFARFLIDEHTTREGLLTRLEAFLDMVAAFRSGNREP